MMQNLKQYPSLPSPKSPLSYNSKSTKKLRDSSEFEGFLWGCVAPKAMARFKELRANLLRLRAIHIHPIGIRKLNGFMET